jgi:hypothetical protein
VPEPNPSIVMNITHIWSRDLTWTVLDYL